MLTVIVVIVVAFLLAIVLGWDADNYFEGWCIIGLSVIVGATIAFGIGKHLPTTREICRVESLQPLSDGGGYFLRKITQNGSDRIVYNVFHADGTVEATSLKYGADVILDEMTDTTSQPRLEEMCDQKTGGGSWILYPRNSIYTFHIPSGTVDFKYRK